MGYQGKAILRLNDRLRTESTAIFINPKEFSRKGEGQGKQGSIGNNLFNHYVVILDYINSKILLQPHQQSVYTRN